MDEDRIISCPPSPIPEELVMAEPETTNGTPNSSTLPRSARRCRIPRLNRSTSARLKGDLLDSIKCENRPKSMTLSSPRDYPWQLEGRYGDMGSVASMPFSIDDDSSVKSFGSFVSYTSFASQSQGTEASLSRPISRSHYGKKYILHCDRHLAKQEEYLTPTQRKDKEIRQLKSALMKQTKRCEEKEMEIETLKAEMQRLQDTIAELRDGKHNLMNSSQESDHLDSMNTKNSASEISFESNDTDRSDMQNTVTMNNDDSGVSNVLSMSPRNSSEFDDLDRHHSKVTTADKAVCTDLSLFDFSAPVNKTEINHITTVNHSQRNFSESSVAENCKDNGSQLEKLAVAASPRLSQEFERFLTTYKQELEQLKAQHREHYQDLKERFNERVDDLLQKLTEANSRYLELRPLFDRAQDKILNIESQLSEVQKDIENQEDYHNQMYLKMYRKGQEAARFEQADEALDFSQRMPKRVSVPDLLRQLQQLELELDQTKQLYREAARGMGDRQAEYTLRFLKDAVFYFLTKKDKEHLKAIQSILGFTDAERMAVAKAMKHRRLFCSPFKL
ncbi:polyamine-modulated factor 1-binding protein 1-like isoform X2 [Stegodyphus dumicola]|uniref:polyamine-modulated factor 1-binding protein 1-like isoform X2 n=1 Tax=Stegodyphus dumicola TaxID=202533 RepID=UPI0015AD457E|nr:polyamine-modulated factor 1-binding protein 1-like isoform X2 [Stegodyphus dumicola]